MTSVEFTRAMERILSETYGEFLDRQRGTAKQTQWHAEDGWLIVYTTSRVQGGPHDGKFVTQTFKPVGKGARSGRGHAEEWVVNYERGFATRKAAKARALRLYRQHSPRWNARHPEEGERNG